MMAVTGKKVGKGGELLVQVLTQGAEFTLDGSGGGLLLERCRVPRVPGRSKRWVATLSSDVVNCSEGKSSFLFVDSFSVVDFLQ